MAAHLAIFVIALTLAALGSAQDILGSPDNPVTYDERYVDGMKAYTAQKWPECIILLRQALEEYGHVEETWRKCFRLCQGEERSVPGDYMRDQEVEFFHRVIQHSTCIRLCKESHLGVQPEAGIPTYVKEHMEELEGYNYLQMALYQEKKVREAMKACATYAYHNPHNIHVMTNLNFYSNQPEVTEEDKKPLFPQLYRDLYTQGHQLYFKQDWEKMVETFEAVLQEFYGALEECRLRCDGPLRYTRVLDFAQAMSKQYIAVKECHTNCIEKLGRFRNDRREDFFGSIFHFLQFGYYWLNRSMDAVQASATQVRLEPDSEVARRNAVFYRQQPGVTRKDFLPREDVLPHIKELEAEHAFLHVVDELSGHLLEVEGEGVVNAEGDQDDELLLEQDFVNFPIGSNKPKQEKKELIPVVVETPADHNGVERLVMDDLLSQQQCDQLIELASYGKEGDGYNRKSPHTQYEKFEGLHVLDAAKAAVEGEVQTPLSQLYVNASRSVKDFVARQFNLQQPLYFSYTHLVCRTAKENQAGRGDLSHPVHSDNCVLDEALGECLKKAPAYTWRDYSAILYLNGGDFEGGRFFFAHSPKDLSPQAFVDPKCGRMVGFSAGKENMHGVTAVTKGKRCAVALWFTLDPAHREASFEAAENLLSGAVV